MAECDSLSTFNLDTLKERVISKLQDETKIEGVHSNVSSEALAELVDQLTLNAKEILRIASGITIMKSKDIISTDEIKQAMDMQSKGVDNYLPQVWW